MTRIWSAIAAAAAFVLILESSPSTQSRAPTWAPGSIR